MSMHHAEALSADKDCQKCKERRINCDRSQPECRKCISRGFRCPGYGRVLKWVQGVASRGVLAGRRLPIRTSISGAGISPNNLAEESQNQLVRLYHGLNSIPRPPNSHLDAMTQELMHHFQSSISAKLAWVDSPTNPWRNIIIPLAWGSKMVLDAVLALSSEDLAAKLQQGHPHHRHFQENSLRLRNQALISLSNQISLMSQETSSTNLDPSQAQQALASALILYNVELLGAESVKWRMHLQAARAIFQWKKQRFPREALTDETDSFLLYEQYYASVFAGLTTFDTPGEPLDDIQYTDTTAFFGDFVNIINRATQIERLDHDQKYEIHPSLVTSMVQEVDEAKHCMIASSQMFHFPNEDARVSFHRLVCIFHDATLIYIHQALSKHYSPEFDIQYLRDSILDNSASLSDKVSFAQDLVWPLFIAGTECQGIPDKQEIVARDIEVVMRISGTLDRRKVLDFLRHFWSLGPNSSVTWIQLMRTQAPNYHMLIL